MEPELKRYLDAMNHKLDKIDRGLYGDKDNDQEGLIEKHAKHDERIEKIETTHKKVAWWGGGFLVALEFGWHYIKDFFTK